MVDIAFIGSIFTVLVVGCVVVAANTRERALRVKALADHFGFRQHGAEHLRGVHEGVTVCLYAQVGSDHDENRTHIRCGLLDPLPHGLVVTPMGFLGRMSQLLWDGNVEVDGLDDVLWVRGSDEEAIRELLGDAETQERIQRLLAQGGQLHLEERTLHLQFPGTPFEHAEDRVREAVQLTRRLAETRRAHWWCFAQAHDLTLDPQVDGLRGTIDGISIALVEGRLTVALTTPLPPGTRVAHKAHEPASVRFCDPILDATLAASTSNAQELLARLDDTELHGPLLEILHRHPGALLSDDRLVVSLGWLGARLAPTVEAAVAVARILG